MVAVGRRNTQVILEPVSGVGRWAIGQGELSIDCVETVFDALQSGNVPIAGP